MQRCASMSAIGAGIVNERGQKAEIFKRLLAQLPATRLAQDWRKTGARLVRVWAGIALGIANT